MPIRVPYGDYCWQRAGINSPVCDHFDNTGGHATCDLGHYGQDDVADGVKKPKSCASYEVNYVKD